MQKLLIAGFALFIISCASGHHRPYEEKMAPARDFSAVQAGLQSAVSSSPHLSFKKIGRIAYDGFQTAMWCVSFRPQAPMSYKVLINAGIHGNEPASVAFALQFMEHLANNPDTYSSVAIDIVPIVKPWGWIHDIRYNRDGIDINRDFSTFHSQEAKAIADFLKDKSYDLVLDLHEDRFAKGFYIYQYGMDDKAMAENVVAAIKHMGYPIEEKVNLLILKAENGIIDAPMWGLWYMRLTGQMSLSNYYRLNHSQQVYTIENPTEFGMQERVRMQWTAVEVLIEGSRYRK